MNYIYKFGTIIICLGIMAITLCSCHEQDSPIELKDYNYNNYNDFTISIETEHIETRCEQSPERWGGVNSYKHPYIKDEECINLIDFTRYAILNLIMTIDKDVYGRVLIECYKGKFNVIEDTKKIIKDVNIGANENLLLTISLSAKVDLSKVYFYLANSFDTFSTDLTPYNFQTVPKTKRTDEKNFPDNTKLEDIFLYQRKNESCVFYNVHKLSDTNDIKAIKNKIILKRYNSTIYVLHKEKIDCSAGNDTGYHYNTSKPLEKLPCYLMHPGNFGTYNSYRTYVVYAGLSLTAEPKINQAIIPNSSIYTNTPINTLMYIDNEMTRVFSNAVSMGTYGSTVGTGNGNTWYEYLNYNPEYPLYGFSPLSLITSNKESYPVDAETGEELKYICFFCAIIRDNSNTKINTSEIYYNFLPLPENGLQRNKKYIYYIDAATVWDNKLTYEEWANKDNTRSYTSNLNIVPKESYEIIELDYDEPLPF